MKIQLMIIPFFIAFVLSTAISSLTILVYRALGIIDKSTAKEHPKHIHEKPVPRGGGIPIYLSILLTAITLLPLDRHMVAIMTGAGLILLTGILDDIFDLSPYLRLLVGTIVGLIVVGGGVIINYVSNPFATGVLNFDNPIIAGGLSVLWIVWAMNFVNMGAKGLDGQLPGVTLIAAIVMGLLSFRFVNDMTTWPSSILSFALAGAYSGLLLFNAYPQKIMPGWGGGALAGYFLATLSMLSGAKLATALIVLGIPLMDVVYAIIRRMAAGKSPVWGDNKHLHHKLLALGWSKRKIAGFYWLVTALLGIAALNLNSQYKIYTIVLTGVVVGGLLIWINLFLSLNRRGQDSGLKT